MIEKLHIAPYEKERPSEYADRLGVVYAKQVSLKHKKDNGQFFTPIPIARLMAALTLLAVCNIKEQDDWKAATKQSMGVSNGTQTQ